MSTALGMRRRGVVSREYNDSAINNGSAIANTKEHSLEDFEIIKTIGTGSFGRVCLCCEKNEAKFYALKVLGIADVIKLKQVDHVKNEKNILKLVQHPFIVRMEWHHRDDKYLYMMFDYVCGGELFSYLRSSGKFVVCTATFYAAEITSALEYLHSLQIVYRDLKPENLLLDRAGHLKITDFGFAKKLVDRTWTLCGTPEYLAPEIIQSKGHNRAVDWWALGILIYEMLAGCPPYFDENPFGTYEKILSGRLEFPRLFDSVGKDIIKKLLIQDRTKRLGNMKNGADDIKRHRFFKGLRWDDVYQKKLTPPIVPKVSYDGDWRNFNDYPETNLDDAAVVSEADLHIFSDF